VFCRDLLTATIYNNTGLCYKSQKQFVEAKEYYGKSYHIRSKTLGEDHPETIIVMHNLAECLLASPDKEDQQAGLHWQQQIMALVGSAEDHHNEDENGEETPQVRINKSKKAKKQNEEEVIKAGSKEKKETEQHTTFSPNDPYDGRHKNNKRRK